MSNDEKKLNTQDFDPSMFELVNQDIGAKIHDQKFETKPTTFAKDAFKRFCKNKSSVVGAIIIGILLMGSFLSFLSPYDIKSAHTDETLLPAKLFNTGTHWWDGTIKYTNIAYDDVNDCPAGFQKQYAIDMKDNQADVTIDQYYAYAHGGYMRITSVKNKDFYVRSETPFTITDSENFKMSVDMVNIDGIAEDELCDSYKVELRAGSQSTSPMYLLRDWSNDFSPFEINVSARLSELSLSEVNNCQLFITGKPKSDESKFYYFMFKTITLTSDDTSKKELLDEISITDANFTAGMKKDPVEGFPTGYWASTGTMNVYQAHYHTVDFYYDYYGDVFGERTGFDIGESLVEQYIAKGWCKFDDFSDPSTFQVLDEKHCPIKSVEQSLYASAGGFWHFTCTVYYYRYKGYSTAPRYLFGTDALGHDLLTVALSSLKTSLLVAIVSSAVCLAIGLVWGSISGYFGGNVDIIMERITDILGGVPWIVMMTLIILLLGNSIVTFGIALVMTGWIGTASRTRTQFYRFKGREYILASRTLGASDVRLIFRHILPNGLGTIVTGSVLMIPGCIFSEASISYLGLGLQGVDSFGVLLSSNQIYLSSRPLLVIVPAIIISLLMISFNLFGNGLRDALNPTLKGGE